MKTNQIMQLQFDDYNLDIGHKDMMGSITKLWTIGNAMRAKKGLPELDLSNYLRSPETEELVRACEIEFGIRDIQDIESIEDSNSVDSTELEIKSKKKKGVVKTIKSPLIKTKEGRYGGTWTHLYILLDAAGKLDASFKVQIYKRVVEGGLLQWRDDSGDSYKALNIAIDEVCLKQSGQRAYTAIYMNVANLIRKKVNPTGGHWNTATHEELAYRTRIENSLISFIKADLVNGYDHFISLIDKIQ
jgi:hypothetical protein